jgi:hypothetical protein
MFGRKKKDTECVVLSTRLNELETRFNSLEDAYIHLRHAYRNALGIAVREVSYGMTMNAGGDDAVDTKAGDKECLQNMSHHELYIEAERLARIAKVPSDV